MGEETGVKATDFFASGRYTGGDMQVRWEGRKLVYLDLVMLLNFLVDFLLLLGTNRLTGYPPDAGRAALAAVSGGVYAGACLLPGFFFLGSFLWRTVALFGMAVVAFGTNRSAVQRGAVFLLLSMALGGIALGVRGSRFVTPVLCAGALWMMCRIGFRGSIGSREYVPVELTAGDRRVSVIALRDTGNTLRDPVTGEQVLVAGAELGAKLLGLTVSQLRNPVETVASGKGLRLIPYHAVGQPGGMLVACRFQNAKIGNTYRDPLVAFAPEGIGRSGVYQMLTGGTL